MDETYRMLGREHELDLEREARNRGVAAALRSGGRLRLEGAEPKRARGKRRTGRRVYGRLAALFR